MTVPVCLSVRLSVCLRAYLLNCTSDLYRIFCACCLSPWLGLPLAALRYVKYVGLLAILRLGGSVAGWLVCWTQAQGMLVTIITRRVPVISALQRQGAGDVFIRRT